MAIDPLSDMLSLLSVQFVTSGGFVAGGRWALHFRRPDSIKFSAVIRGRCWLRMDGLDAPVQLEAGDVILMNGLQPLVLASDMKKRPIDSTMAFIKAVNGIATIGNGKDFFMLGGHVALDSPLGDFLLEGLPLLIHIRSSSNEAETLRWLMQRLVEEYTASRPGSASAQSQIAQLMFIHSIRAYLASSSSLPTGWLQAFHDERLAPAIEAMHNDPARQWSLKELANRAGMSRTNFALHFRSAVGTSPLVYLLRWRMRLAQKALWEGNVGLSTLSESLGYTSESAFSNAFKREVGMAPKRYQSMLKARNDQY